MGFWRKEDPIVEDGRLKVGGMLQHQRDWWDLPNFIRLLVGGYGAGKSNILCKWSIACALQNAPVWSAIVSPSFPMARRTIIPTIETLLEGKRSLRPDLTWKHNKGDHCFEISIECRPMATLLYLSGDNPSSLKGPNLGTAAIDEPFIQPQAVLDQMHARCRDPRARIRAMGLAGTPEQLNWGYEITEGEMKGNYDVGYVSADTRKNFTLPSDYATRLLKSYDEKTAAAYIQGKFVNLSSGRVFYGFAREINVVARTEKKMMKPLVHFAGMDFNVNPMSYVIGWYSGDQAHIYAEREMPDADTQKACAEIKRLFPQVKLVFPDPSGKRRATNSPGGVSDFVWITRAGFTVMSPTAQWGMRDSLNSVNAMYASGNLTIDPACKKLIRYLSEHSWEQLSSQKQMGHLLDAHRYPITYLFPIHRPQTVIGRMSA